MVRPAMTARELCVEVLSKYGMEHLAADVVLVSVVKDTLTGMGTGTHRSARADWVRSCSGEGCDAAGGENQMAAGGVEQQGGVAAGALCSALPHER